MSTGLTIRKDGALDFLSLGALIHRLDPGIIPFRKATQCQIHVSGGEFNCAANLSNCFGMNTGVASAMVDYPIGDLINERVRAMGAYMFVVTSGGSLGLLLGGALVANVDWHWIFTVNVPIGIAVLALGYRLIDNRPGTGLRNGVDIAGSILMTASMMARSA
jgi:MFS family permease